MAKFIKSIFHPSERRKSRFEDQEEDKNYIPPLDGRRKLSISRSGRMRQANKKRHSLSLELYSKELESIEITNPGNCKVNEIPKETKKEESVRRRHSTDILADDEIDNAFEIIDKT